MATIKLTPDQRETLEALLRKQTLSFRRIAVVVGLSHSYVSRYAKRLGITPPAKQPSPALAKAISLVRDHGWSYKQAAISCNLSFATVRTACLSRGITSPYPRYYSKAAVADYKARLTVPPPPVEIG